jgi:uncharacterized protein YegP (UPF0339 family)
MLNVESAKKDKIELYKDKKGEWRWKRIAINGNNVGASSEGYVKKSDCLDNAQRQFVECEILEED